MDKMKILDNSDEHLLPILPRIISEKLKKKTEKIKFIGGCSFGRVFKAVLSDGEVLAVKAYRMQGFQYAEAEQLQILCLQNFFAFCFSVDKNFFKE